MKKLLLSLITLLCTFNMVQAGNKLNEDLYHYEVEAYDGVSAIPGYTIVKVWSYGKQKDLTNNYCMRNAIHAILFKGCAENGTNAGVKALVPEGYEAHANFFNNFFDGKYLQYVQLSNNGMRDAGDVIKLKNNRYKIATIVMINLSALRKFLENEKIIKPLDFLFD